MERHRFGKFFGSIAAVAWRERRERRGRRLAAASSEQLRAAAGIRYGNFQFGQNLRIYPARGWYRVQDMYYARGRGCTPCAVRGRRRRRRRRKVEEGRERRIRRRTKGKYVWRVWRPLRRAGGGCQATPFSPHILTPPSTNPQNPLVRSPFASWRTLSSVLCLALSLVSHSSRFLFLAFIQRDV